jgi:RluA family pseudouridine synthase
MNLVVDKDQHGWTLLAFLKENCKEGLSANKLKKLIESKNCKVNGKVQIFASYLLMQGDKVDITLGIDPEKLSFIFQDEFFAVINKPPGLVSENAMIVKAIGDKAKSWKIAHRLDKETSGLLLLAKNLKAEEAARALFSKREIEKYYLAIVDGKVKDKFGVIDYQLAKVGESQGQTQYGKVEQGGLRAITHYQVLEYGKDSSLILCDLKTGRTHQIRVHLSEKGHPLLGDLQYGKKTFKCSYQSARHLLHARMLKFTHPFTLKKIELIAPLPEDFQKALVDLQISQAKVKNI